MSGAPLVYDLGDVCASLGGLNDRLVEILEAVRALKPAPEAQHAEPEESPRMQGYRECADLKKFEIEGLLVENATLKVEVERLQAVIADQALTIGTLRDTWARKAAEVEASKDCCNRRIAAEMERDVQAAELKRFREREIDVRALVADCLDGDDSAYSSDVDHDNQARLARAVRDFRLEPAP